MKHTGQKFYFYSFSTLIVLWFTFVIGCVLLLSSILSYKNTIIDLEALSIDYTKSIISEINLNLDSYIGTVSNMTEIIATDNDAISLLKSTDNVGSMEKIQKSMDIIAKTRGDITNIALISKSGMVLLNDSQKYYNINSQYRYEDWFLKPVSDSSSIFISPTHVESIVANEHPWVVSVSRSVVDPDTNEIIGVVVIDLNFFNIKSFCQNIGMGNNGYVFIIDDSLNTIYHPKQQLLYAGFKIDPINDILNSDDIFKNDRLIYAKHKSSLSGWWIVGAVNKNELVKNRLSVLKFYFLLWILFLVLAFFVSLFVSRSISKPIKSLEKTMQLAENGNLSIRSDTDAYNEIGHLSRVFNNMLSRIEGLLKHSVNVEKEKRESEIKALQAQINPHFLYNTLDTIIWLSAVGENDSVVTATSALASLFRTSISKAEKYVTLKTELSNIENYLIIQKLRFRDKITFSINVPPEHQLYRVPKLILQPIVENAIIHGINLTQKGGNINIGSIINQNMLIITVSDNGIGINDALIQEMFTPKKDTNSGIGVNNVNDRIKLCFGEQYGLHYFSQEGIGTRVEIQLPIIKGDSSNE